MSVKKAITVLSWMIEKKKKLSNNLESAIIDEEYDTVTRAYKALIKANNVDIENLKFLQKQLVPNCKHPKKMRDRASDGQWYCMNCNLDLDI